MIIHSREDIEKQIKEWGFLPFFADSIPGFSLEKMTPPELWFPEDDLSDMGVWDYKTDIILEADCAYGKFYKKKACFISMDWFPDFVNYRRSRYVLTPDEQSILNVLAEHHSLLSKELKRLSGYLPKKTPRISNPINRLILEETKLPHRKAKTDKESFDTAITRLQMAGYIVSAAFEYNYDKQGKRYGWGVARYCTPEDFFGEDRINVKYDAQTSYEKLYSHLRKILPHAQEEQIKQIIG
ncbi:MAG: hypothetical protein IJ665_10845 [Phocaeicola sp.]|nr:hypothetical protein [Phocaeicola sp.]